MPFYSLVNDVVPEPLRTAGGFVQAPDGPGLGVELDRAVLAAQTVALAEER